MRPRDREGARRPRPTDPGADPRRPLRGARGQDRRRPRARAQGNGDPPARRARGPGHPPERRDPVPARRRAGVRRARRRAPDAGGRGGAGDHRRARASRSRRLRRERRRRAARRGRAADHQRRQGRDHRADAHPGRLARVPRVDGPPDRPCGAERGRRRARRQVVRGEHLHERGVRGPRGPPSPEGEAGRPDLGRAPDAERGGDDRQRHPGHPQPPDGSRGPRRRAHRHRLRVDGSHARDRALARGPGPHPPGGLAGGGAGPREGRGALEEPRGHDRRARRLGRHRRLAVPSEVRLRAHRPAARPAGHRVREGVLPAAVERRRRAAGHRWRPGDRARGPADPQPLLPRALRHHPAALRRAGGATIPPGAAPVLRSVRRRDRAPDRHPPQRRAQGDRAGRHEAAHPPEPIAPQPVEDVVRDPAGRHEALGRRPRREPAR